MHTQLTQQNLKELDNGARQKATRLGEMLVKLIELDNG